MRQRLFAPQQLIPVSHAPGEAGRETLGRADEKNPLEWFFTVKDEHLEIVRGDGFVRGRFTRQGNDWVGDLEWGNGERTNVVLVPTGDCSEVKTNQVWWYKR